MLMPPDLDKKLSQYKALLLKWSKTINLVSPATLKDIDRRHIQDSLQLASLLPEGTKTLIDIGSGAGFPGLVLAMIRPEIEVHLVESDQRKCSFMRTVSRETFTPVVIHNTRAENVDIKSACVISARALAKLGDLLSMTKIWWECNPEILLVFPKGSNWENEVSAAKECFEFDLQTAPSQTEKDAQILLLQHIKSL